MQLGLFESQSSLQSRLTLALEAQLTKERWAPEYDHQWKMWSMGDRARLPALRASVRPTSVNGSSGWPTPAANEYEPTDVARMEARRAECKERTGNGNGFGLTLGQLVAGWPTPKVGTGGSASGCGKADRASRSRLEDVVQTASGPLPSSSPAPTGGRGAYRLNPAFSLWLQGYPSRWMALAPSAASVRSAARATRSSRR